MNGFRRIVYCSLSAYFLGAIQLIGQAGQAAPKLIVGVVVDQMRFDQLHRYRGRFGKNGFNRLLSEGFSFTNASIGYIPTFTAPGHASIYTGSSPSHHGIISNSWLERSENKVVLSIEDSSVTIIGSKTPNLFGMSPARLRLNTVSDQLKKASDNGSKVISISLKDRGAILPGGLLANAAYWYDWETSPGYFVSSTYYMQDLPGWVTKFNEKEKPDAYLNQVWEPLFPVETYTASGADDNGFERAIGGKETPTFPYEFGKLRERYREMAAEYQLLWLSPYGNTLLTEFALEAIKQEGLGEDGITDMLMLSYTVTDVIGHTLGQQAVEMEDVVLRLDEDISDLLSNLDRRVGKGRYIFFLTSDHGAMLNGTKFKGQEMPSGVASTGRYGVVLTGFLNEKYGAHGWIRHFDNEQLYLNHEVIEEQQLKLAEFREEVALFLSKQQGIAGAVTSDQLQSEKYNQGLKKMVQEGFYKERSGDVILIYEPGFVPDPRTNLRVEQIKGSTHGSGYEYDTRVPLLWFGQGIRQGQSARAVSGTDIAPTLAFFLNLDLDGKSPGEPLSELLGSKED